MWTWASVSQTFTFPYFLSNGGSCTYRTAILCGLMQGTQFLCNRLINSRIALVIQTTPTIVTSSVVSDTQYSDVQWSMKHLRNAKIIGLTWTKKNPFNTYNMFTLLPGYGQWNARETTKAVIVVFFSFLWGMVFCKRSLNWDKGKAFKFLGIWREFTGLIKTLHILMNVSDLSVRKDVLMYISWYLKLKFMDVQSIFHFIETIFK